MDWCLLCIMFVISSCTATKILYVLPDNVSDVNCPSQPCATLGQYLLDNGSLSVLSDVEYRLLPGEHHVVNNVTIEEALNFSLIGYGLPPAKLVCRSHYYVGWFLSNSYNISIRNLVFSQCSVTVELFNELNVDMVASLILFNCLHCKVEDVDFFGYGFAGINLFLNSHLSNIIIDMTEVKPSMYMCGQKFLIIFFHTEYDHINDSVLLIDQFAISGYNEMCHMIYEAMAIVVYESYGIINGVR